MKINIKKLLFFIPVIIAIILFILLVLNKPKPSIKNAEEQTAFVIMAGQTQFFCILIQRMV